jgi:Flp pilus assembly protein TadG
MTDHADSILKRGIKRFLRDDKGSLAIMAGLSIIGLCVCGGIAIDFGRVTSAHARLAAAMDVAALHVAGMVNKTDAELKALAEPVMLKNYGGNTYDQVTGFTLVTDKATRTLRIDAKVTVAMGFMKLINVPTMEAPVRTEAIMGSGGSSIEVALVLDNTGSMDEVAGGERKMDALLEAAHDFIDTVIADPANQTPYYSKAAIVPYDANVNPGSMLNAARQPNSTGCGTQWGCPTYKYTPTNKTYTQKACVTERMGSNAASDSDMAVARAMYNYSAACVTAQVRPLTSVKSDLHATIDTMVDGGTTAGHIGIQWGLQMLSPKTTLVSGAAKPGSYTDPKLKKIMIIMTDGIFNTHHCNGLANNASGGCNNANGDSFAQAGAACTTAKNNNIELYFVGIGLGSSTAIDTMTTKCSTDADHKILVSDTTALKNAFARIAANLSSMRLSM